MFQTRPKRKRRLIVDNVKSMSAEDMKVQMLDSEDILIPLDLAPPTKKLMVMQEVGATERLFGFPGELFIFKVASTLVGLLITELSLLLSNVKQMYSRPICLPHELIVGIQITRGRVDFNRDTAVISPCWCRALNMAPFKP